MDVILTGAGGRLRLSANAWLAILVLVLAEGWERKDAHKLTFQDFALLLPDPKYEAERRQRGGYRIGSEDALAFAEAVLRAWKRSRPDDTLDDALSRRIGPEALPLARGVMERLAAFCRMGAFAITMDRAVADAGGQGVD